LEAVAGKDPKWRQVVGMRGTNGDVSVGEPRDGKDQTIVFHVAVSFFNCVQRGFPGFA